MLGLLILLIAYAVPAAAPALAVIWLARGRLSANTAGILAALAFVVGPAYAIWRMEWF